MSAAVLNNFYHFILSLLQTKQRQREEKSLEATKELKPKRISRLHATPLCSSRSRLDKQV